MSSGGSLARRIEVPFRLRFDECGADGRARSSAYLRYAQEAAWLHSERAGFDRHWYAARGLTWLVRCLELDIVEQAQHGETVSVSTEVTAWRRMWARRRSEFSHQADERDLAVALIDWVLLGPSGAAVRVPDEIAQLFAGDVADGFAPARVELPDTPSDAVRHELVVRPQDLDPMAHVNNAVYLEYLEEGFARAGLGAEIGRLPRRYRLEYVAAAESGMPLVGAAWRDGLGWAYRLCGPDDQELLRARLETDPGSWVGG